MSELLFLAHRVPCPPHKGEKIRAYHALCHLARRFKVHLGCFAHDREDEKYLPALRQICASVQVVRLSRARGVLRGLFGVARGASFTEHYFHDAELARWVAECMRRHRPEGIFVYCSAMAPYAMPYASSHRVIFDMVDVDSEKWRAYGTKDGWPANLFYACESRELLALERASASAFDRTLFVSKPESDTFLRLAPETADRVGYYENGVDLDYFNPTLGFVNPFPDGREVVVFTGTMNYRPNIEAVEWFAREVFPRILARRNRVEFWIVGANPATRVSRLARLASVYLTGRVQDVRPYLAHADCAVAPLQIARGVQNKILEAMAMAKPVVATREACEGISALAGEELLLAETAEAFADAVISVLVGNRRGLGRRARSRVEADHNWSRNLQVLDRLFGADQSASPTSANLVSGSNGKIECEFGAQKEAALRQP